MRVGQLRTLAWSSANGQALRRNQELVKTDGMDARVNTSDATHSSATDGDATAIAGHNSINAFN